MICFYLLLELLSEHINIKATAVIVVIVVVIIVTIFVRAQVIIT